MEDKRILQLKRIRSGKKGSITKRITQLDRLVSEGGSRTQISYLLEALLVVQKAIQAIHEELLSLESDPETDWIEVENHRIDTCVSEAKAYLEAREGEPASTASLAASWVRTHDVINDLNLESDHQGDDDVIHTTTEETTEMDNLTASMAGMQAANTIGTSSSRIANHLGFGVFSGDASNPHNSISGHRVLNGFAGNYGLFTAGTHNRYGQELTQGTFGYGAPSWQNYSAFQSRNTDGNHFSPFTAVSTISSTNNIEIRPPQLSRPNAETRTVFTTGNQDDIPRSTPQIQRKFTNLV